MLVCADARNIPLREECVQTVVTSPPYWGLRDYGVPGQLGLEPTPEQYVESLVCVFREVRRVLRRDGTLWLNLGDSYAAANRGGHRDSASSTLGGASRRTPEGAARLRKNAVDRQAGPRIRHELGELKPKDLVGIPWRVAFALQADGWWLRSDIIWAKPNPMPESVEDRPTKAHEYVFLLSKSERYYYDHKAVAERAVHAGTALDYTGDQKANCTDVDLQRMQPRGRKIQIGEQRNARTVWTIPSQPYAGAHFASMPPRLAERCIRAGSRPGDRVLDPFVGSGTTVRVARDMGRVGIGLDLNRSYLHEQASKRIRTTAGMGW